MDKQINGKAKEIPYNIVLIGFMGVGKSTVAKTLHTRLGMKIMEMDEEISRREGISIPEIFETRGETYFRNLETELLAQLQDENGYVISCGGGAPLRKTNVDLMKKNGKVVLLTALPETIWHRVQENHERPLLENNKTAAHIERLMSQRQEKYQAAADFTVNTDNKTEKEICDEILEKLQII